MAQTDPLIGATAGNYTLERRIGSGGMGDVYRGVQRKIGSQVAIKILHATSASDPEAVRRFQIEAQAGNRIEHPGVIKVVDAGQLRDGRPYLVMPLLEGRSLAEHLLANPRLPIDEACRIGIDVLDAVGAAHAKGFVHRDLKPPNVFLTSDGRVVILDFGVAKLMASDSPARLTRTGTAIGTPYYMAPEQIKEQGVGPTSDVYSVGVVVFEMLCGRLPFDGESAFDVMQGHLEKRPPPPRALRPEIPLAVQEVVLAAMAKDPARRFTNAAAMRDALRSAAAGLHASDPDLGRIDLAATLRRSAPPPGALAAARKAALAAPAPPAPAPGPTPIKAPPAGRARSRLATYLPWLIALVAVAVALGVIFGRGSDPEPTPAPAPAPAPAVDAAVASIDAAAAVLDPSARNPLSPQRPRPDAATTAGALADDEGIVVIDTNPQRAAVLIDGRVVGITPKQLHLRVGIHAVELRKSGYSHEVRSIDVAHAPPVVLAITLSPDDSIPDLKDPFGQPVMAEVEITSVPDRVQFRVDGIVFGLTPWAGRMVVGHHTVTFAEPGFIAVETELAVNPDKLNVIDVVLSRR